MPNWYATSNRATSAPPPKPTSSQAVRSIRNSCGRNTPYTSRPATPSARRQKPMPVIAPLAEMPDERAAEQRAVAGGVAVIEHRAAPANPAVHPGRVPGAGVDRRLEPGGRVGQGARTGEGH